MHILNGRVYILPFCFIYLQVKSIYLFKLTYYGYKNTFAQSYAEENAINFVALGEEKIIGDVNGDGSVTVQDATVLQKYLAGLVTLSDEQLSVADTNGDGSVTVADATVIQKYLAGLVTVLG